LNTLATILRWLSATLFVFALIAMITMVVSDTLNLLRPTSIHRQAGALSFVLIGASYVSLQLSFRRPWNEKLKGVLLGIAFLFWGSTQFLSPSAWVTAMDTAVVLIFVIDLSLIIVERLKQSTRITES
jgi:hypothetical protein